MKLGLGLGLKRVSEKKRIRLHVSTEEWYIWQNKIPKDSNKLFETLGQVTINVGTLNEVRVSEVRVRVKLGLGLGLGLS